MNKEFGTYALFIIWTAIAVGVPALIFESACISICGIVSACLSPIIIGMKQRFVKEYPATSIHIAMYVIYTIILVIYIAFADLDYDSIKSGATASLFFAAYIIIVLFIESSFSESRQKAEFNKLKVGQMFEEANSREGVPYYMHEKYLEFTRKTLWVIKELRHYNDIVLQDVHFSPRTKSVTLDELKAYTPTNGITWYRPKEYYDMVIEAIKARAAKETYRPDDLI